jgi:WD40 repeat protein
VAFSPDGRTVAVTDGAAVTADDAVYLYDLKSGVNLRVIRGHQGLIAGLAFSPDGKWLATGSWDSTALVWNVAVPAPKWEPGQKP